MKFNKNRPFSEQDYSLLKAEVEQKISEIPLMSADTIGGAKIGADRESLELDENGNLQVKLSQGGSTVGAISRTSTGALGANRATKTTLGTVRGGQDPGDATEADIVTKFNALLAVLRAGYVLFD